MDSLIEEFGIKLWVVVFGLVLAAFLGLIIRSFSRRSSDGLNRDAGLDRSARDPRSPGHRADAMRRHTAPVNVGPSERRRQRRQQGTPHRPKLTMVDLAQRLSVDAEFLKAFRPAYGRISLPKKRGGYRSIVVPDEPTKKLQQRVLHRLLGRLTVHPAALGFEKGKSIADHAAVHAGSAVIVKADIIDFFNSTTSKRVGDYFRRIGWDDACSAILTRICCDEGGLPQGAPTSPRLSNLVNKGFDELLQTIAVRRGMKYSRYADDLCFSYADERRKTGERIRGLLQEVRRIGRTYGYRLHGKDKSRIVRQHRRQLVCGLVINEKPNLPRETRRRLRAIRHRMATKGEATMSREQLAGWTAYEKMIEAKQSA